MVEGGLAVAAIRERVARSSRGRAGGKAKPRPVRLPTERKHRAGNGLRVLVTGRKGFDVPATVEALEDALASFKALLGGGGAANDHDAA